MISAHEDTYDVAAFETLTNDGRTLIGSVVLYDICGHSVRVPLRMVSGAARPTYLPCDEVGPDVYNWLDRFAGPEILEILVEELVERREQLKTLDVQRPMIGWYVGKNRGHNS